MSMRRTRLQLSSALAFVLAFVGGSAQAQTPEVDVAERIRLRELLRVPAATKVSLQTTRKLPSDQPLKVHLGFGLDFETRNNLARWLAGWNTKYGKRYGQLEIVDDLATAQVILAGFRDTDWTLTTLTSYPDRSAAPTTLAPSATEKFTPVYSYIMLPAPEELIVIRRIRYDEKALGRNANVPMRDIRVKDAGSQLCNVFLRLFKECSTVSSK